MIAVAVTLFAFQSAAQMGAGLNLGIIKPTDGNSEALFGGELNFKYTISENLRAGVNLGFYQKSNTAAGIKSSNSAIPFSVFGEYIFLDSDFKPYAGLHLGGLRTGGKSGNLSYNTSYFALTPTVGADYMVTDQLGVNFNIKYGVNFFRNAFTDELDNFSTISPNIGVFFNF
jgi:outer membrane protein W